MSEDWRPDTLAVRGGLTRTGFDETAEALFLTSGFVYRTAADAEAAFAGDVDRFVYSRYGNPTVAGFQERLRLIEGAPACFATSSGMAAVWVALAALVSAGDRVVAARSLFGSCFVILDEILPRFGVTTDFVDGSDLDQWRAALATPAAAVFFESPSNPMQELVDVAAVCELAHAAGAQVVVTDVWAPAVDRLRDEHPEIEVVDSTAALVASPLDVYAPCALGHALTDEVVDTLSATVVCGAANNQLAHPGVEKALAERGIVYAPDYCVNAGGLIQVADELEGFSFERANQRASGIFDTTHAVLELAATDAISPALAADRLAEKRMRDIGRLRGIWLR